MKQVYSDRARSTGCRAGGRSKAITPPVRSITGRPILTFELCSAPRESEAGGRSERRLSWKKNDVAGSDTCPVRIQGTWCHVTRLFSVKIPATDSPAFPMWGSRRALALCENASVALNDGPSQDGMTCTVIPIVLRALPCCCTVVAHGCADWERACSLRIIRRVVVQDGVHSGKRAPAPVKCCTERTGQ
jgi:hypothetical protein